ncbi:MAG: cardiolipin synthase ClsB [Rhodoferax sp.]|jgi:cardiolipin synthase|nr:cardiolipin synthase ClsB [Rhodoferax sp.]
MAQLRGGHQLQLLQGGNAYFGSLIDAIDHSRLEVRFETYIFHLDRSGCLVAEALERAATRGVAVFLTMDGVGTPSLLPEWASRLDRSGVRWHIFSPLGRVGLLIPSRWRRLHRKLVVVDGQVAYCGGINVLDDYVDPNHGDLSEPRLDFAVRVTGPLVQEARAVMASFWWRLQLTSEVNAREFPAAWRGLQDSMRRAIGERTRGPRQSSAAERRIAPGARAALVLRDNLRNRRKIENAYLAAIEGARSEVVVANAYFLPGARLRRTLIKAAQRGVRVRLLLQGRYEYFLQYHASRPVYGALLAAGVEIHEYATSFLHAKVAVVDMRWATVGSSNLDPLSLLLAREANVVVDDADFAHELRQRLEEAMTQGGQVLEAQAFANRPWRQRLLEALAFGLMRLGLLLIGRRY